MKVHMSLPSTNISKTTEFYRILLNNDPTKVKTDYVKFDPSNIDLNISFHQSVEVPYNGQHLGFQLNSLEDFDETYARLKTAKLITDDKEVSTCCYAKQDKFWVTDPDGFKWEFYYLLENTKEKSNQSTDCSLSENLKGCC